MKLAELKIDPDFKNLLPPLDAETYTGLEKDIMANGMFAPIITWNGYVADGHHRYEICKAHRIEEIQTKELKKTSKSDVMEWIIIHQDRRRNMTKRELALVYSKYEEQMSIEAKERQRGGQGGVLLSSNLNEAKKEPNPIRTASVVAKKIGVSENTYRDLKLINEKGTEDQKARVDMGGKGNGASTIAREIKDGTKDGERKCRKCGRILPSTEFTNNKNIFVCRDCESKRKREADRRNEIRVMPDSLNPDIPIIVTSEMTITEFKNICSNMEFSLKQAIEINKQFLNKSVVTEIINVIDGHINNINAIKRRIENETEGETVQI